jgi:cell wall-active antibiotic response 4TMS protein YvqF/B-box zinc finger protein
MTCPNHPETQAVAFCRSCGKPLCDECKHAAQGTIFCAEHAPAPAAAAPPPPPVAAPYRGDATASPGVAAFLGFIPGVGAIYNGQYAKGLVHAVIFGLIISIMSHSGGDGEPMLAFLMVAWVFYMVFEAYHTARKRLLGEPVDEFSSLVNMRPGGRGFPTGAVALIVLGIVLLLNTLDILDFRYIARYWPVVLILAGVYMLWARLSAENPVQGQEARNGHE